jgi:hypothetical protein
MFAERVIRALFGPMFDDVTTHLTRVITDRLTALHGRLNTMDATLQAAIDNVSSKVDGVATGLATEAGEIKTNLQAVAQQIRDGLDPTEAVTRLNTIADRIGTLGGDIGALSDVVSIENATPAPADGGTPTG